MRLVCVFAVQVVAWSAGHAQTPAVSARSPDSAALGVQMCRGDTTCLNWATRLARYRVRDSVHRRALLDTVARQAAIWAARRPARYAYTVRRTGAWLGPLAWASFDVQVQFNQPTVRDSTGQRVSLVGADAAWLGIDALFVALRSALRDGSDYVEAVYDSTYGFPLRLHTDRLGFTDSWYDVRVTHFRRW
jgi:uncharacterized protein DUF6174